MPAVVMLLCCSTLAIFHMPGAQESCGSSSAPFVIVNREVENSDGVQKRGGNMEGTWQEHDGADGQTDDYKVPTRTLRPDL